MVCLVQRATLLLAASSAVSALALKRDASVCTDVRDRVPWQQLTEDEKTAYINADLCLMDAPSISGIPGAVTRWDDLQWPHVAQTVTVHHVGAFLPFHRYYMTVHERMIKDECGYTGRMPYWDELADIKDVAGSELWSDAYYGGNGDATTHCVTTGPFAGLTLQWRADGTASPHCLTRVFSQHAFNLTAQPGIDECRALPDYAAAWPCWAEGPHNGGHGGVGGVMADGTLSPGDPVFYLHHSWLDRLWWGWQGLDPEARLADMGGPNVPTGSVPGSAGYPTADITDYFGDGGGNVTTLNHTLWVTGLYPNVTIGDVMDLNGPTICSEYIDPE